MAGEAVRFVIRKGLPFMAKKSVEMARYYGSEALRNKNLQKMAINYGPKEITPIVQKVGSEALDQLSTKIKPNKRYKTNTKDLDGGAIIDIGKSTNKMLMSPNYERGMAKYAWEQAKIYGYRGTLGQFLTALGLADIVPKKGITNLNLARIMRATPGSALRATTGSGIIDKAKEKGTTSLTKGGIAGGPYRVDYEKGIELLYDPDSRMENTLQGRNKHY